jgi:hypothetical protein
MITNCLTTPFTKTLTLKINYSERRENQYRCGSAVLNTLDPHLGGVKVVNI